MKFCSQCGIQNEDTNEFCSNCGAAFQNQFQSQGQFQPQYTMPTPVINAEDPLKTKAMLALIFGAVGAVMLFFGYTSIISLGLAIAGLVLGGQARKQMPAEHPNRGMATAGYILSLIVVVLAAIVVVGAIACIGFMGCAGAGLFSEIIQSSM